VTSSGITPVVHPLVGHSYCVPLEIDSVPDSKEECQLTTKIPEGNMDVYCDYTVLYNTEFFNAFAVVSTDINTEKSVLQEEERKSFLPKRKSSRLLGRKSDRGETTLGYKGNNVFYLDKIKNHFYCITMNVDLMLRAFLN
jgi:hypothetical protein